MVAPIGNFSSIAPVNTPSTQAAAALNNTAAAASKLIQDSLTLSPQAQAASAAVDSDGDHDGR